MSALGLALRQIRYENRAFWRNPAAAFFTVVFPLMFLVIFNVVFGGDERTDASGRAASVSTFYVPAILVFAVVGTCYTNVAMNVAFTREGGLLKRVRGTPLPSWAFLFGKIAHAVLLTALLVAVVVAAGALFYDVQLPSTSLPAFLLTVTLGAACLCALGLAVTAAIPNADAAPAIVQASVLPLLFISDVFIPLDDAPVWLTTLGDIFPVRHFAQAMHTSFDPYQTGAGFEWAHLGLVAVWLAVGLAVTVRWFRWEPRR